MNRTARVALFHGVSKGFVLAQVTLNSIPNDVVLVRVTACTLCGSDIHTYQGKRKEPTPSILGHEMIGTIEEIGESCCPVDARGHAIQVGSRVTWSIMAHCGSCFYCQSDLPQKCLRLLKYGHSLFEDASDLLGGLADYCLVQPGTTLVRLADHVSDELACPASCATATMMSALEEARVQPNQRVLVIGGGMLGLTVVRILREEGSLRIGCVENVAERRALAVQLGAEFAESMDEWERNQLTSENRFQEGWDVVIETSGFTQAVLFGISQLRSGGRMVLVGSVWPDGQMQISAEQLVRRCITLSGVHNYKPRHLVQAVEFLERESSQPLANLVSSWYSLEESIKPCKWLALRKATCASG